MTFQMSVEEIQRLLLRLAEYVGPAAYQYLKILKDSDYPIDYDWYLLTLLFSQITDDSALEEICYLAMKKGISDVSKFEQIAKKIVLEENE